MAIVNLPQGDFEEAVAASLPVDTPFTAETGPELGIPPPGLTRVRRRDGLVVDLPSIYSVYHV